MAPFKAKKQESNLESVSGSSGSEARPLQVLSTTARSDGIVIHFVG